jgi:hypothetical protein
MDTAKTQIPEGTQVDHGQRARERIKPSETSLYASLNSKAVTDEARALVDSLRHGIEFHEGHTGSRAYKRRGDKLEQFEFALGAFLADLLRAAGNEEADGWVFRSMKAETFTGEPVSLRTFRHIVTALSEVQLITRVPGYQVWKSAGFAQADNTPLVTEARAACFKATPVLLGIAKAKGVTPESIHQHFIQALPRHPLVLKGSPRRKHGTHGEKSPGKRLRIERTPLTEQLEGDVRRLNEFLDTFTPIGGIHRGYFRVFNQGDLEGFAWNKGGRLYSQGGDSYQRLKEEKRVLMTIDGEAVAEIDLKASYLTVLHGLLGLPFDTTPDAYAVEDLEPLWVDDNDMRRWVVKAWTTATLGHHQHHSRWPSDTIKEFNKKTGKSLSKLYPIKKVRETMEAKHPVLKDWGKLGLSWADLMYVESVAVMNTMLELMDKYQIPSFSIHDSLIVRERDLATAKETLARQYEEVIGIKPGLETTYKDGTASY